MARSTDPALTDLRQVDLFADLSPKDLKVLAGLAKLQRFGDGDLIVQQGTESARLHVIVEGTARVMLGDRELATLGPGDYFGEISVIDRKPRTADVVAAGPVVTRSLASFSLRPALVKNPDLMMKLFVKVCERLRNTEAALAAQSLTT